MVDVSIDLLKLRRNFSRIGIDEVSTGRKA
jgi:hypothetical protein